MTPYARPLGALAGLLVFAAAAAAAGPVLFDDLGDYHRAVTTRSPQAQRFFDQGLRLYYARNYQEAERSFREGARLDPGCASCWWGAGLALGADHEMGLGPTAERSRAAREALERAAALAQRVTPVERALIGALARRCGLVPPGEGSLATSPDSAYADALRGVAAMFPEDPDVATLYAESLMDLADWDLWTFDDQPGPSTVEIVAILQQALQRHPLHPGANHHYIHAIEASARPARAAEAAGRLDGLMPGAGHMVHAPCRILIPLGQYEAASDAGRRAVAADRACAAGTAAGSPGAYARYALEHALALWFSLLMEGRSAEALETARDAARQAAAITTTATDVWPRPAASDAALAAPLFTLVRFGRWEEVLREPLPSPDRAYPRAIWHYARGLAFAGTGRPEEARGEQSALDSLRLAADRELVVGRNAAGLLLDLASGALAGAAAAGAGDVTGAIPLLESAVQIEDSLRDDLPPDWPVPVRQKLGAELMAADRTRDAERVYAEDLRRHPHNGWSLFGLQESLRRQMKGKSAAEAEARFHRAWARADTPLQASAF